MSAMMRAPWLPPTTSRRSGPFTSGAAYCTAAAARIAGRIGVPTVVVLPASAGSRSSTPGKDVAMARTRLDRKRLARPSTALASWMMPGTPANFAATSGGSVG
jgi:hypothetical protein